ncbi:MAG: hypothetical protein QXN71_00085 [Candidatus Aenigmatarchaeota archaeon]
MPKEKKSGKVSVEKILTGKDIQWKKTDGKTPYLETSIDKLYKLVKERSRVGFDEAAEKFNAEREQIESWAKILEEHKLIKVHYPVFGRPVMIFREMEKKKFIKEGLKQKPKNRMTKIGIGIAGCLLVFFGYVNFVTNAFTLSIRSQLNVIFWRFFGIFGFLPYPINIIIPVSIVIVILLIITKLKRKKSNTEERIGSKLKNIKKELGS